MDRRLFYLSDFIKKLEKVNISSYIKLTFQNCMIFIYEE